MAPFEDSGTFWIPATPETAVHGHVVYDGQRFTLTWSEQELTDTEDDEKIPPGQPIIVARLRTRGDVTFLDATYQGTSWGGEESWSAQAALIGGHVADPIFCRVSFSFDVLVAWSEAPSVIDWTASEGTTGTIDLASTALADAKVDNVPVGLVTRVTSPTTPNQYAASYQRQVWFTAEPPPCALNELLDTWVRPLQDLLVTLLGRTVHLTQMHVTPVEPISTNGPSQKSLTVAFAGVDPNPTPAATWSGLRNWGTPTMFVREDLPAAFADLLAGWFRTRERFAGATTLICGPFYAPFMYSEHRYSATFQAAEAIAQALYGGGELERAAHKERVDAIVRSARAGGVRDQHISWAERVLRSKNTMPLAKLIEQLVRDSGALGEAVLAAAPDFPKRAAAARARVAHPGGSGTSNADQYWMGQILTWIVRTRLVRESGVPWATIEEQVLRRGHFSQAVARL